MYLAAIIYSSEIDYINHSYLTLREVNNLCFNHSLFSATYHGLAARRDFPRPVCVHCSKFDMYMLKWKEKILKYKQK